jgi:hypothetical protein
LFLSFERFTFTSGFEFFLDNFFDMFSLGKINFFNKDCVANTPENTEERAPEDDVMSIRYAKCGVGVEAASSFFYHMI